MLNKKTILIISLPLQKSHHFLLPLPPHSIKADKTLQVSDIQASRQMDADCSSEVCKLLLDCSGMKSPESLNLLRCNRWVGQREM